MQAARRLGATALAAVMAYAPATAMQAQTTSSTCSVSGLGTPGAIGDLCQKARDLFAFVMPQAGIALSGGNPLLGEGGTMGGWGKRALSLRITAVDGFVPRNAVTLTEGITPTSSNFGAARTPVPVPSLDASIGLFSGIPAGLTNVGGVDLLLGATYLPTVDEDEFSLKPQTSSFALSYGVRVGALQESSLIPGVSISYMRRRLPTVSLGYTLTNDSLTVGDLATTSNSLRLVASKRFAILGIALGAGRDEIENTAAVRGVVNEALVGVPPLRTAVELDGLRNTTTRNTVFANLSFGLSIARIVAEAGWTGAGDAYPTVNTFDGRRASYGYRYGSLGVTVRF